MKANLNSRIYDCKVFHSRNRPVKHQFTYRYFNFCIDLDEVHTLSSMSLLFGLEKFRPFRFVPEDSIFSNRNGSANELKESVIRYAKEKGILEPVKRVEFLGHVRTFGYSYNPASFFFGYSSDNKVLFGVVEVINTFREKKAYFIAAQDEKMTAFQEKLFYVSPFSDLDTQFEFHLKPPRETVFVQIDSTKSEPNQESIQVHAALTGTSKTFNNLALAKAIIQYPLVSLSVMFKIHVQALFLYIKGARYIKKNCQIELQKGGLS